MRILQQRQAILLVDLSNFVARAIAVQQDGYLKLLLQMLLKLRRQYPHHGFIFAVEGAGTLMRQQRLPCYKEGRVPSPEFNDARQLAIKMLKMINCRFLKAPDGEADDAIASYCHYNPDDSCIIVSNDRDLWQAIRCNVAVRATVKSTTTDIDRFACERILGVPPKAVPLMKALLGDASDNIPRGVERVHKKKLLRLANEAGGDVKQLAEATNQADYLTVLDKEKIALAHTTVKRHLSVTKARINKNYLQRQYLGDATALKRFLEQHNVEITEVEVKTIAGATK